MRILFITSSHNGLSQRAWIELKKRGHLIEIHEATTGENMEVAVSNFEPHLIIAPFLKKAIPDTIWRNYVCLIVHPGIKGDRGPSSLDWAIANEETEWGVTILQADEEMDAGDIWATENFEMRPVSKSTLYRHEVTQHAIEGLLRAVENFEDPNFKPEPLDYNCKTVRGIWRDPMRQSYRQLDWKDSTAEIAKKIRASDSSPGILDTLFDEPYYLYGATPEGRLKGRPGEVLAYRHGAICRATGDGAVWISHLKKKPGGFKLPATLALGEKLAGVPYSKLSLFDPYDDLDTFREIKYEERNGVGYLHFDFYNGAMSTAQCLRLRNALMAIKIRQVKVIVLQGGRDIWSNGIHLNVIENAASPADESWANIIAIDDLVREILYSDHQLVISAMQGNAGAGGVMMALAADQVFARSGVVMNPHYKKMGLFGSEYWTYLLPRRVGRANAQQLTDQCLPLGTEAAKETGLLDNHFGRNLSEFNLEVQDFAEITARDRALPLMLNDKLVRREQDERIKPIESYRREELAQMYNNFYGPNRDYHILREHFVKKLKSAPVLTAQPVVSAV